MSRLEEVARKLAEKNLQRLSLDKMLSKSLDHMDLVEMEESFSRHDHDGLYKIVEDIDFEIDELLNLLTEICHGPGSDNKTGTIVEIDYKDNDFE